MYKQHSFVVEQEIAALERLGHPCVVTLFEAIETAKYVHLVLEFLEGGCLSALVGDGKRLVESESLRLLRQMVSGLYHLHTVGVVHRDLKLENLMLDAHRNARIVDFGLATIIDSPGQLLREICGTAEYQAPELHKRLAHTGPPLDIWSLGVVFCAMLFGDLPFTGINKQHVAKRVLRGVYQLPTEASEKALSLLQWMLSMEAQDRPGAEELLKHPCLKIQVH